MTAGNDLTEQKRQSLELSAMVLATLSEGVAMVRRSDDSLVYLNPFFARTFGYEPEDLIGKPLATLRPLQPDLGGGGIELLGQCKDGSLILVRSRTTTHEHPDHGTVDVYLTEDVTALRGAERQRDQQEQALRASLAEKEVLLREIHHRVKNNLQVISSLLGLQTRRTRDPVAQAALRESHARVRAISLLHEQLYCADDLARVDLVDYARTVAGEVLRSFGAPRRLVCRVSGPVLPLPLDLAVPCGLILNELVTNAMKHAFPGERAGRITVTVVAEGDSVALTVTDDGVGDTGPLDKPDSLGVSLVRTLASQLEGEATFTVEEGTTCRVRFPNKKKAA